LANLTGKRRLKARASSGTRCGSHATVIECLRHLLSATIGLGLVGWIACATKPLGLFFLFAL
jgi:hypothetical protein